MDTLAPGIGDNQPPAIEALRDVLTVKAQPLLARRDELLAAAARAPANVDNEETGKKMADLIRLLREVYKKANALRIAEKEPFLMGGRAVDSFVQDRLLLPVEKEADRLEGLLNRFQREQKRLADAAAAEAKRKADEAAAAAARAAKAAADEAERIRREAAAKAEADRRAAEELAKAQAAAIETDDDLALAIETEERVKAEAADRARRDAAAQEAARAAQAAADLAAEQAAQEAEAARKAAEVAPKKAAQVRGDHSLGSLRSEWKARDVDRATIDLEALRFYFTEAAIEAAVRAFIKAGGRQIVGAVVFEDFPTVVR